MNCMTWTRAEDALIEPQARYLVRLEGEDRWHVVMSGRSIGERLAAAEKTTMHPTWVARITDPEE